LARGEIQCIGATTLDEYRQYIEKDGALARRFQIVMVDAPSIDETIEILTNIKDKYEDHHHVTYTPEAIEQSVKLSERYITDRFLPDKAIDVMDEVGARVHIRNITVPEEIVILERQIEDVKKQKNQVVKSQKYEEAAQLRDREKRLIDQLEAAKKLWEDDTKRRRYIVTEDNVAEVVSMIDGDSCYESRAEGKPQNIGYGRNSQSSYHWARCSHRKTHQSHTAYSCGLERP
jgi:ATP-dependent Clp protease ATP-binding subunit ClpC